MIYLTFYIRINRNLVTTLFLLLKTYYLIKIITRYYSITK